MKTQWTFGLALLTGLVCLSAIPAAASGAPLPAGVPNIYDPKVQAHFQPAGTAELRNNPDFPVVLLMNTSGEQPQALLIGLDARNGRDTWSITGDPIILIMVFSDAETVHGLYVDRGFADLGHASGDYATLDAASLPALPDLLKAVPDGRAETNI